MKAAGIIIDRDGVAVNDAYYPGSVARAGKRLRLDDGGHEDDGEAKQKKEKITDDFVVHCVVPFENSRFFISSFSIKKRGCRTFVRQPLCHMISYLVYCLYILLLLYIRKLHNEPVLQYVGEAFDISTQLFYSAFHTDQKIRADEHGKYVMYQEVAPL